MPEAKFYWIRLPTPGSPLTQVIQISGFTKVINWHQSCNSQNETLRAEPANGRIIFLFMNGRQEMTVEKRDWRELSEAASKERDSEKLITLVSELMKALDEKRSQREPAET